MTGGARQQVTRATDHFTRWLAELQRARLDGSFIAVKQRIEAERRTAGIDPLAATIGRFTPEVRKFGSVACKDYLWLKYGMAGPPSTPDEFARLSEKSADYVFVPPKMLRFYRANGPEPDRYNVAWQRDYCLANARNQLSHDIAGAKRSLVPLTDPATQTKFDAMLGATGPVLMLICHLGYGQVRGYLGNTYARGVLAAGSKASIEPTIARTIAYRSLRCLMEGGVLFIAPDGPNGEQRQTVDLGGLSIGISTGASRLGYDAGARVVFMNPHYENGLFTPHFRTGPTPDPQEKRREFIARVTEFYAECLREALWGDPAQLIVPFQFYPVLA